jgi:hypothetical protein
MITITTKATGFDPESNISLDVSVRALYNGKERIGRSENETQAFRQENPEAARNFACW